MDFTSIVNDRLFSINKVLSQKEEEYATAVDRFHNFKVAARILNCTPENALLGMAMKHFVSVLDIVESLDTDKPKLDPSLIDEKIGDAINYLILLEGMLAERIEQQNQKDSK